MHFFDLETNVYFLVYVGLTGVKLWALVDAITRPTAAFPAADKQTKAFWTVLLGMFFLANILFQSIIGILALIGTVAAFVYLVDVKPALVAVTRRR
ncbi:MAG: DUF2516 family protein [Marmoricola sp.]